MKRLGHLASVTGRQRLPPLVAGQVAVVLGEHLRADRVADHRGHLGLARPDVAQVDRVARRVGAQRVVDQVDVHRAGEGVGHDQRRGRQVVHLDVRVDPTLEVTVTRQHADHRQVAGVHPLADLLLEGAGVADAGGAPVADQVEPELVQVGGEPGALVVVHDDLGTRGQGGLDPGLAGQAPVDGVAGEDGRAHHHLRVGRVRARGDGRDRDRAVVE